MSLFRTGACQNLVEVLDVYKIKVAGIQEVRWAGKGQLISIVYTSQEWKRDTSLGVDLPYTKP